MKLVYVYVVHMLTIFKSLEPASLTACRSGPRVC